MPKIIKTIIQNFKKFRKNNKSNLNIFFEFFAIIMIWRGIQDLLTICIFPNNPIISCIICISIGILILITDNGKLDELNETPKT